jgi:hypothetical protein
MIMFTTTTSTLNLFLFRFFYCGFLAIAVDDRANFFWQQKNFGLFRGLLVLLPFQGEATEEWQFLMAKWFLMGALVLLACGIFPVWSALGSLILYLNLFMPINVRLEPFDDNIVVFNLIVLIFANLGTWQLFLNGDLKKLRQSAWPLQLFALNLSLVYFSAFLSKLYLGGAKWAQGEYLQNYLLERYLQAGNNVSLFTAQHLWICMACSIGILIFEGTFWLVLFTHRIKIALIAIGPFIHLFIYLIMGLNFMKVYMLGYLAFIPYHELYRRWQQRWMSI